MVPETFSDKECEVIAVKFVPYRYYLRIRGIYALCNRQLSLTLPNRLTDQIGNKKAIE